ncbi:AAHS family 4-hydroxybenzoate transporter-like MFS transporter [Novosphingobium sp. SG751A]|uniref:MFS transporter n=1 Tax=Novosphingobium sp. SG751A TaxID=2587000 RepID=UPI001556821C|nr:MFS transporter [Novosphingobium sp. SG751A]NOW47967.1 AAHS family 4-hydroxybenzoate transporter-like MFS transporter [Novosphingobium sp. SG751A]
MAVSQENPQNQGAMSSIIDDNAWGLSQKLLLALVSLAILMDGFDNQALGFALPGLMRDWGVTKSALGGALAAAQLGMLIGAIGGGVLGDRMGRKMALVISVVMFGAATLLIGFVGSPSQLAALRFVAGIGLGATFPNAAALVAEFTPARHRSLAVIISIVCVPLGGVLGGVGASFILPTTGWQALFFIAGGCTLALAVFLILLVPESVAFLLCSGASDDRIQNSLRRMGVHMDIHALMQSASDSKVQQLPLSAIIAPTWLRDSLLIWSAFFFALVSVYAAFNWLPVLLTESGLDIAQAARGLAAFNMGGVVVALTAGTMIGRFGSRWVMVVMSLVASAAALALATLSHRELPLVGMFLLIAVEGGCVNGVQSSLYALASSIYPAPLRARGVGMATGVGRLGAIASVLFGAMVAGAWGLAGFHSSIAVAMVIVAVALFLMMRHVPCRASNNQTI